MSLTAFAAATMAAGAVTLIAIGAQPHRTRRLVTPAAQATQRRRPLSARALRQQVERNLPDTIELIVLAVRAGHLPLAAIATTLPRIHPALRPAFATFVRHAHAGRRVADALEVLVQHLGPALAPLADSLAAADRYGLPLAPVLDRLATEARQHRRRQVDTLARQLPIRLAAPLVTCTLPSFVFLAIVPLLLAAFSSLRT